MTPEQRRNLTRPSLNRSGASRAHGRTVGRGAVQLRSVDPRLRARRLAGLTRGSASSRSAVDRSATPRV